MDTIFINGRFPNGALRAFGVTGGKISAIESDPGRLPVGPDRIDLGGALVVPGLVEGHVHLDKTFLGDVWRPHRPCANGFNVRERVAFEKEYFASAAPAVRRGAALVEAVVARGTTHMRSHVDIDSKAGLSNLEAVLELKESYRDAVSIQIVAFPQSGIIADPGTAELLEEAVRSGADLVGGLDPAGFDRDVDGHLDVVFGIAERHGAGIDIHLHDPDSLGLMELEEIARRTKALSMQGRVTVSHAYSLGEVAAPAMFRTASALADAGVSIMTNAPGNHPFPPILALRESGVTVFAGNDNIRDAWWPYGEGDMLERAMMIGYRSGFYTDEELAVAFDLATAAAARALGIENYGLMVGASADFVVLDAQHVPEAVVARPARKAVYKAGHLVARDGVYRGRGGTI